MEIAYKYIEVSDGIIVVFNSIDFKVNKELEIKCISISSNMYLGIENGAIPVDDEFLKLLQKAEYIYIGVSPHDAFKVEIVGHVAIDKITVGKLIAFFEMQKQNMMSETVSES